MERKSDSVRRLVAEGEYQKALSIVKDFRIGITKEQHNTLVRAYECMNYPKFYAQIGRNPQADIEAGLSVLKAMYG